MENSYEIDVQAGQIIEGKTFKPWYTCRKCQEIKPRDEFIYRLSRAQAAAQGYAGNVRVDAVSSLCRACRPRRKLTELTERELRTKVEFGELHESVVDAMVNKRKAKALALQTRAARARWEEVAKGEWMIHIKAVSEEIRATTYQHKYAKKCGNQPRTDFFAYYLTELNKLRDHLRGERRRAEEAPFETHWVGCMDTEVRNAIAKAWQAMPIEDRVMLRMPEVVNNARDDNDQQGSNRQRLYTSRTLSKDAKERLLAISRNHQQALKREQKLADNLSASTEGESK